MSGVMGTPGHAPVVPASPVAIPESGEPPLDELDVLLPPPPDELELLVLPPLDELDVLLPPPLDELELLAEPPLDELELPFPPLDELELLLLPPLDELELLVLPLLDELELLVLPLLDELELPLLLPLDEVEPLLLPDELELLPFPASGEGELSPPPPVDEQPKCDTASAATTREVQEYNRSNIAINSLRVSGYRPAGGPEHGKPCKPTPPVANRGADSSNSGALGIPAAGAGARGRRHPHELQCPERTRF